MSKFRRMDTLLSAAEAGAILGRSPRTVQRLADAGTLPIARNSHPGAAAIAASSSGLTIGTTRVLPPLPVTYSTPSIR